MKKILFAIPKGRILKDLIPIFSKAGIIPEAEFFNDESRKLIFSTNHDDLELLKVRSFDVATFVKFGAADVGICGSDVLKEFESCDIFPLIDLGIGKCRLSIAGHKNGPKLDLSSLTHVRIATKYPNIATKFFANIGIQSEAIKLNGSIEIAPRLKICDFILDLVSSGKTLMENEMIELNKVMDVSSYFIANRTSFKLANHKINQLIDIFNAS